LRADRAAGQTVAGGDASITVNGKTLPFGSASSGFAFQGTSIVRTGSQVRFDADYLLEPAGLHVTRHYAATDGSPTFEAWTTFERTGRRPVSLADLNAIALTVPAGRIHSLTGLQGDNTGATHDSAFTRQSRTLASGEHLNLGASAARRRRPCRGSRSTARPTSSLRPLWSGAWVSRG
jgi:hypothetical protein